MTKDQLKILGWDALSQIQFWQGQLNQVNKQIEELVEQEKLKPPAKPPTEEKSE